MIELLKIHAMLNSARACRHRKTTNGLSKAAFNKATEFADYITAWMDAREAAPPRTCDR
jgi:hypothetical protein